MYKVTCLYDGKTYTLHDPKSEILRIYDDELETEDSLPGSFKFTISFDHPHIDKVVGLSSDIRIYDGDAEIFRCRPMDDGEDFYRSRTFTCEGELAFLYDSIQPRRELHDITPLQFFTLLLEEHNSQVSNDGPIDKRFTLGVVEVTDSNDSLYRYTNRETTLDCILDKIIGRLGGHLVVRKESNKRYLDIKLDETTAGDQPIQLGVNLMDYAKDTDYTQVATACIPLGAPQEETEIAALDAYLTVKSVNNNKEMIKIQSAVDAFGFICKVVSFPDITVPANLLSAGQAWLTDGQYADMTLELTAVDLHALGQNVSALRVNNKVRVVSEPHGMDRYFLVSKRTYHLTEPESDTVTFGTSLKRKSYTSEASSKVTAVINHSEQLRRNIDSIIAGERDNVSNIINQATHGYVVLDPNDGPERILIMDSNSFTNGVPNAQKIWKWDLNGLAYSSTGINGPWSTAAITMNGQISANFITVGELMASLIKVGTLSDVNNVNSWNMETGDFALSAAATIGGKTAATIASEAVDAQTQTDIFNKLTNNGQTMGIYLDSTNNKLYINATYVATGTLKDVGNNTSFDLATGEFTMKKGTIQLGNSSTDYLKIDNSGNLTSVKDNYKLKMNGGYLQGLVSTTTYGILDLNIMDVDNSNAKTVVLESGKNLVLDAATKIELSIGATGRLAGGAFGASGYTRYQMLTVTSNGIEVNDKNGNTIVATTPVSNVSQVRIAKNVVKIQNDSGSDALTTNANGINYIRTGGDQGLTQTFQIYESKLDPSTGDLMQLYTTKTSLVFKNGILVDIHY